MDAVISLTWDEGDSTNVIERSDMDGADNDVPIDLAAGGVAVPPRANCRTLICMRRWAWSGVAALVLALLIAARWAWRDDEPRSTMKRPAGSRTNVRVRHLALDVEAFRAEQTARIARARTFVESAGARSGSSTARGMGLDLIRPQCILGPAELCDVLAPLVEACEAGDTRTCLAVGQYLADTPPRPLIASAFFHLACRGGDQAGCDRVAELKPGAVSPIACELDPFGCAWRAYRTGGPAFATACELGVADACLGMANATRHEPDRVRAYLETACQLGSPQACEELGRLLSPGCKPDADCFPPDPETAKAALAIACAAGFESACRSRTP